MAPVGGSDEHRRGSSGGGRGNCSPVNNPGSGGPGDLEQMRPHALLPWGGCPRAKRTGAALTRRRGHSRRSGKVLSLEERFEVRCCAVEAHLLNGDVFLAI